MNIKMCVNPNCPYTKNINPKDELCPKCGEKAGEVGFKDSANMIKLKNSIKNGTIEPFTEKEIENLSKPEEEIKKEEIKSGVFRGYNAKQKNKITIITLTDTGMEVITERRHVIGGKGEENIIPYSSIQGVTIKRHGLGKVVEIKTMAETFKFRVFSTTAFVDMLNDKINSIG